MTAEEYITSKGLECKRSGKELLIKCIFNNCDKDSRTNERHLYFSDETGQYQCKKCEVTGNLVTLARHFGDDPFALGFTESRTPITRAKTVKESPPKTSHEQIEEWHLNLPQEIRDWFGEDRGLTNEIINQAKLGWDGTSVIIPIPDGKGGWLYAKKRQPPGKEGVSPRYLLPTGAKTALFGRETLLGAKSVVICEGELDALVLRSHGFIAVSSTSGAGTFDESWIVEFEGIPSVSIIYDNDDPGRSGALKVGRLIPHARIVNLPEEVGEKGDVTDFFVKLKKKSGDFEELLGTGKSAKEIEEKGERYKPLPLPANPTTIQEWRKVIKKHFPDCLASAEVGLAVITQLLIRDVRNPFGLVYVDVPSAGKTITLNFFAEIDELVYSTDAFTPAAFVSHASNVKRETLETVDLLPRIRFKLMIVRDLAPMFAEKQENLLKNLGVLTRVFDGEGYESDSGLHGKRGYRGDYTFMLLAGTTPIAPRVWKAMGNLGSRLFFLNMNVRDKNEDVLADQLIQDNFKVKEQECREATKNLILTLWSTYAKGCSWEKSGDPKELRKILSRCARLLSRFRATVNVWSDSGSEDDRQQHSNVAIEKPDRINQLLYNLARGHALACGRTNLVVEDMWPAIEVTLNSAPYDRIRLLDILLELGGVASTSEVERAIDCSNPTALKEMDTFRVLKIAEVEKVKTITVGQPEKLISLREEFKWFYSPECQTLRDMKRGAIAE